MQEPFPRPVRMPSGEIEERLGGFDPAEASRIAHETARALLSRVRADPDPGVVRRLGEFTDRHGIDALAELWSAAAARSLPGALWRISLLRASIRQNAAQAGIQFTRGVEVLRTIDPVVAGAETPTGPAEIMELADRILHGVFAGDFALALERAAAYCRIAEAGAAALADDDDLVAPARASALTRRASRLAAFAEDLSASARLWRLDALD